MSGPETSLPQYPATPSTPKSLIFRLIFVKTNHSHKKQAHQASRFCKASILFEKEPKFTCITLESTRIVNKYQYACTLLSAQTQIQLQLGVQLCSNSTIPLFHCYNCIKRYNHTMTTCHNYSPNSKEVQNFNYLNYIYREQNAFLKHINYNNITLNFMKSLQRNHFKADESLNILEHF